MWTYVREDDEYNGEEEVWGSSDDVDALARQRREEIPSFLLTSDSNEDDVKYRAGGEVEGEAKGEDCDEVGDDEPEELPLPGEDLPWNFSQSWNSCSSRLICLRQSGHFGSNVVFIKKFAMVTQREQNSCPQERRLFSRYSSKQIGHWLIIILGFFSLSLAMIVATVEKETTLLSIIAIVRKVSDGS